MPGMSPRVGYNNKDVGQGCDRSWDWILLCGSGWPWTCHPSVSTSQVLDPNNTGLRAICSTVGGLPGTSFLVNHTADGSSVPLAGYSRSWSARMFLTKSATISRTTTVTQTWILYMQLGKEWDFCFSGRKANCNCVVSAVLRLYVPAAVLCFVMS